MLAREPRSSNMLSRQSYSTFGDDYHANGTKCEASWCHFHGAGTRCKTRNSRYLMHVMEEYPVSYQARADSVMAPFKKLRVHMQLRRP